MFRRDDPSSILSVTCCSSLATTPFFLLLLLPGEKQDAAQLAMGQTYEQLDKNEVGRLGKRGEEVVPAGILTDVGVRA